MLKGHNAIRSIPLNLTRNDEKEINQLEYSCRRRRLYFIAGIRALLPRFNASSRFKRNRLDSCRPAEDGINRLHWPFRF